MPQLLRVRCLAAISPVTSGDTSLTCGLPAGFLRPPRQPGKESRPDGRRSQVTADRNVVSKLLPPGLSRGVTTPHYEDMPDAPKIPPPKKLRTHRSEGAPAGAALADEHSQALLNPACSRARSSLRRAWSEARKPRRCPNRHRLEAGSAAQLGVPVGLAWVPLHGRPRRQAQGQPAAERARIPMARQAGARPDTIKALTDLLKVRSAA